LHIDIDPKAPLAIPEWRLLGADSLIHPLRERFIANIEQW